MISSGVIIQLTTNSFDLLLKDDEEEEEHDNKSKTRRLTDGDDYMHALKRHENDGR